MKAELREHLGHEKNKAVVNPKGNTRRIMEYVIEKGDEKPGFVPQ